MWKSLYKNGSLCLDKNNAVVRTLLLFEQISKAGVIIESRSYLKFRLYRLKVRLINNLYCAILREQYDPSISTNFSTKLSNAAKQKYAKHVETKDSVKRRARYASNSGDARKLGLGDRDLKKSSATDRTRSHGEGRGSLGKPLTSKSSIYGRFHSRLRVRTMAAHARHYIYSASSADARVSTLSASHASAFHRHAASLRAYRGLHISPSLPLHGHKLSEHLSRQKRGGKDARVRPPPTSASVSRDVQRLQYATFICTGRLLRAAKERQDRELQFRVWNTKMKGYAQGT